MPVEAKRRVRLTKTPTQIFKVCTVCVCRLRSRACRLGPFRADCAHGPRCAPGVSARSVRDGPTGPACCQGPALTPQGRGRPPRGVGPHRRAAHRDGPCSRPERVLKCAAKPDRGLPYRPSGYRRAPSRRRTATAQDGRRRPAGESTRDTWRHAATWPVRWGRWPLGNAAVELTVDPQRPRLSFRS
jgi:hypothetical protein